MGEFVGGARPHPARVQANQRGKFVSTFQQMEARRRGKLTTAQVRELANAGDANRVEQHPTSIAWGFQSSILNPLYPRLNSSHFHFFLNLILISPVCGFMFTIKSSFQLISRRFLSDMATMKAAVMYGPGGPEVLKLENRPVPTPMPGQVLIRVKAFGLNRSE
jgi:hypothetical protein